MKKLIILIALISISSGLFANNDSVKEKIAATPITTLPFSKSKVAFCSEPTWTFYESQTKNLPMYTYKDLGMTQRNIDPNTESILCRRFQINNRDFDLVAVEISVSEWVKYILATYKNGELIDHIEAEVSWYSGGSLFMKQWQINANQEIVVTHLKINESAPIPCFSKFTSVNAQRIDTYYTIDTNGKFHQLKQVKFQPETYTRTYLNNKTKDIWNGNEVPLDK